MIDELQKEGPDPSAAEAGVKLWNSPEFENTERLIRRVLALLLDSLPITVLTASLVLSFKGLAPQTTAIHLGFWFAYEAACVGRWGRSGGKKLMRLTVIDKDGGEPDAVASLKRTGVKLGILVPTVFLPGDMARFVCLGLLLLPVMMDLMQRGLPDRAAGTLVVWKK